MHIRDLAQALNLPLEGNPSLEIKVLAPITSPTPHSIHFVEHLKKAGDCLEKGGAFLLPHTFKGDLDLKADKAYLFSKTPRLSFVALLDVFNPYKHLQPTREALSPSANTHPSVSLGPHSIIGKKARLEEGVVLAGNNYIGEEVVIKKGSFLAPGVVVLAGCQVGADCIIGPNSSIGGEGFSYQETEAGLIKIPQIGRVVLEDKVELGANVCIDRATLGETRIGFNTKIDNLVQIGHNVQVGPHCVIVSQVGIGGSSRLGAKVVLAGQVGIADHAEIGEGTQIGGQSGVMSRQVVPPRSRVMGSPIIPYREHLKIHSMLKYLPELVKTFKKK